MDKFIDLTPENIENEHLCCIIRSKKTHPGVEAKRAWLAERLTEGHIFRKLDEKATVFIEYAPLEKAWVPIEGDNYIYIYCLWVLGDYREHGYGTKLMESCIADAKAQGRSGVCMLGSLKQKAWLSDQATLVVRVLGIALDLLQDAVFDVHENTAIVVASRSRARVRANDGVAVLLPCPLVSGRIVLSRLPERDALLFRQLVSHANPPEYEDVLSTLLGLYGGDSGGYNPKRGLLMF